MQQLHLMMKKIIAEPDNTAATYPHVSTPVELVSGENENSPVTKIVDESSDTQHVEEIPDEVSLSDSHEQTEILLDEKDDRVPDTSNHDKSVHLPDAQLAESHDDRSADASAAQFNEALNAEQDIEAVELSIGLPGARSDEVADVQSVELPSAQASELPVVQSDEAVDVQSEDVLGAQTSELPVAQSEEVANVQSGELPGAQTSELSNAQSDEVANVQTEELPDAQVSGLSGEQSEAAADVRSEVLLDAQPADLPDVQSSELPVVQSVDVSSSQSEVLKTNVLATIDDGQQIFASDDNLPDDKATIAGSAVYDKSLSKLNKAVVDMGQVSDLELVIDEDLSSEHVITEPVPQKTGFLKRWLTRAVSWAKRLVSFGRKS